MTRGLKVPLERTNILKRKIFKNIAFNSILCHFMFSSDIIISSFWKFQHNLFFLMHLFTLNKFRALPNVSFSFISLFSFTISNRRKGFRCAFHRSKIQFSLMKELCQIAFGAVSPCFIYSSAFLWNEKMK